MANPIQLGIDTGTSSTTDELTSSASHTGSLRSCLNSPREKGLPEATLATPTSVPIQRLPWNPMLNILSFLPTLEVMKNIHMTCRAWRYLPPGDGHLDLSKYIIQDADLAHIVKMPLRSLNLQYCEKFIWSGRDRIVKFSKITKEGIKHLQQLLTLKVLSMKDQYISGTPFEDISELSLTALDLSNCHNLRDRDVLAPLARMPLTYLNLDIQHLLDESLVHLAEMPLTSLDLSSTSITDNGLAHLTKARLQYLNLRKILPSDAITDAGLAHLVNMPLVDLNLCNCSGITDKGIALIAKPTLTSLDLTHCENITDAGLAALKNLPLKCLNLRKCVKVTGRCLSYFSKMPLEQLE